MIPISCQLSIFITPWSGHTTPIWTLGLLKENLKEETQRMTGLPQLVSLALIEEGLGRMDRPWSITHACAYCWIWVMGGRLIASSGYCYESTFQPFNFQSYLIRLSYLISDQSDVWHYIQYYKVQGHMRYTCLTHVSLCIAVQYCEHMYLI